MSPFLFGRIYPEIESSMLWGARLVLLFDPAIEPITLAATLEKVAVARRYLADLKSSLEIQPVLLETVPEGLESLLRPFGPAVVKAETSSLPPRIKEALPDLPDNLKLLLSEAMRLDADLVVTEDSAKLEASDQVPRSANIEVKDCQGALKSCEVFLRGHRIPWSCSLPIWYDTFGSFYAVTERHPLLEELSSLMEQKCQRGEANKRVAEYSRSVAFPRMSNVCYGRDHLLFYGQQKRAARRKELQRQDFWLEAGYHLNHYFLLLWAGVDQMCWVVNEALGLGFDLENAKHWKKVGPTKTPYLEQLRGKSERLHSYFTSPDFLDWFKQVRAIRHYAAHNGTVAPTKLMQKDTEEPTDDELEEMINRDPEWRRILQWQDQIGIPREYLEWLKQGRKQKLLVDSYKPLLEDIIVLEFQGQQAIFRPLESVEWHFDHYIEFLELAAAEAIPFLKRQPAVGDNK